MKISYTYKLIDRYNNFEINAPADYEVPPKKMEVKSFRAKIKAVQNGKPIKGRLNIAEKEEQYTLYPIIEVITTAGGIIDATRELEGKIKLEWVRKTTQRSDSKGRRDKDFTIRKAGEWEITIGKDEFSLNGRDSEFYFSFSTEEATQVITRKKTWVEAWLDEFRMNRYEQAITILHK